MSESTLADELRVLKEFFAEVPRAGNQINIIIIGNTADLKEEILLLKTAIKDFVVKRGEMDSPPSTATKIFYPEPAGAALPPPPAAPGPEKKKRNWSDEVRRAASDRLKKYHAENRRRRELQKD